MTHAKKILGSYKFGIGYECRVLIIINTMFSLFFNQNIFGLGFGDWDWI